MSLSGARIGCLKMTEGRATSKEAKASLDMDTQIAERLHKLSGELELAFQEAANRGLYVQFEKERYGITGYVRRPFKIRITRDVKL